MKNKQIQKQMKKLSKARKNNQNHWKILQRQGKAIKSKEQQSKLVKTRKNKQVKGKTIESYQKQG